MSEPFEGNCPTCGQADCSKLWTLLRDIRDAAEYGTADDWHDVAARLRYMLREAPSGTR